MTFARTLFTGLALLGLAAAAHAQDKDKEALKKDILREVEKRLRMEEEKLLKDIEKVIEEELGRGGKPGPAPLAPVPPRKPRGYMGVRPADLSEDEKKDLGIKNGIRVIEVVQGGPAEKAGLKPDDIIVTMDGRAIDSPQEVPTIVQAAGAGATVKVEYLRGGKKQTAQVTLMRHPQDAEPEPPKKDEKQEGDLRERVKKFLEKRDVPKAEAPPEKPKPKPAPAPQDPSEDFFAFDEEMFDQLRGIFDQLGIDPDQFFEKGKDGKYRFNESFREMFKNLDLEKFKGLLPKGEEAPPPAPRKPEPKRVEPKPAEPKAVRPWLGLQPEELADELRAQLDLEDGVGLLVTEVLPGSPAEKAGVKKNDILTRIDGKAVKGEEALAKFMQTAKVGQEATLTVLRKSKEQTLKVTIGERKE